jgi:predicted NAD/FAD-binding protein
VTVSNLGVQLYVMTFPQNRPRQKIAIVGAGISGLSAAWLLSRAHDVTVYEVENRLGGHSHTVDAPTPHGPVAVDTGFIVYNTVNYPNLVSLFDRLGVVTESSNMGFAVSIDKGRVEYGGDNLVTLFSQWRNMVSPKFWSMLSDLLRFYRQAPGDADTLEANLLSLGDYLDEHGYGKVFQNQHLLPQAAAIWSVPVRDIREYPAAAFIRFCGNHGLLKIVGRPQWRTVVGGSRSYVSRLTAAYAHRVRTGVQVCQVTRTMQGVVVRDGRGGQETYDQVIIATHADQGLAMLETASSAERAVLGAFSYSRNLAVLHSDPNLMPRRRGLWSAWNYLAATMSGHDQQLCVTYWMNRLQNLPAHTPLFVTLNPIHPPDPAKTIRTEVYEHPKFDAAAIRAQKQLWSLQGDGGLWWCGAYFGSGFHEDGLQAGLAVAEAIGGGRRPWSVARESGRIHLTAPPRSAKGLEPAR